MHFRDFAFDLVKYNVKRKNSNVATVEGLPDMEDGIRYIHFPYGNDVKVGDVLCSDDLELTITKISIDTYQGKPELLKAHY